MGDLVVLEDVHTPESSTPSSNSNNSNAKVPDPTVNGTLDSETSREPTPRESDDGQECCVKDSAMKVNISDADEKTMPASSPAGSETDQNILQSDEVILPQVKALKVAEKPQGNIADGANRFRKFDSSRAVVDTAAPIESVRDAVSKFGGIIDWKTHRVQNLERRRNLDQEFEKMQEEMIECKKSSLAAEDAKMEVLNELERTKQQIEELELQLSSWSSGVQEQNRYSDLAKVTADEAVAKEELETVAAKHEAALLELKSVKNELQVALRKAGEAPEDDDIKELIAELVAAKESLNAAQEAYKEAEDQRSAANVALEVDILSWERGVKQVECEVEKLNQEYLSAKDLKSKLDSASALLSSLKAELGSYIGARMKQETADVKSKTEAESSKMRLGSAKKELEQVKLRIGKATVEVSILNLAASSLQSELDKEKEAVSVIKKRGGMAMVTVKSLEEDLSRIKSKTALVEMRTRETREKMVDLPSKLQQAAEKADQAKSLKQAAQEELSRARNEAEQAKAEGCTTETRLHAVEKEIEAAKASEKLALAAVHGLQESETALATGDMDSENVVIISLEEYQMLSKCAQEAEEQAKTRLAAALIQIEAAKKSESKSLQKLEEVSGEFSAKKGTYRTATKKSEKAMNEKLRMEQELRLWRTKNEERRKASQSASFTSVHPVLSPSRIKQKKDSKKNTLSLSSAGGDQSSVEYESSPDVKVAKKKKKSLFPRLLMFLARRKSRKFLF